MNEPQTYSKFSDVQKDLARSALDNYIKMLNFKPNEKILDVGCASGDVMTNILNHRLPKNLRQLMGVDISETMINFAKTHNNNPKIDFMVLDITVENVPDFFWERTITFFRSAASTGYKITRCTRKAFKNIYEILKPGGEILIQCMDKSSFTGAYVPLAEDSKWADYIHDVNKYLSPYHHSKDPQNELNTNLKSVCFDVIVCICEAEKCTFPNLDYIRQFLDAAIPRDFSIPNDRRLEFVEVYINQQRNMKRMLRKIGNEETLFVEHELLVAVPRKPL